MTTSYQSQILTVIKGDNSQIPTDTYQQLMYLLRAKAYTDIRAVNNSDICMIYDIDVFDKSLIRQVY